MSGFRKKCFSKNCSNYITLCTNYGVYCYVCNLINNRNIDCFGRRAEEICVVRFIYDKFGKHNINFNNRIFSGVSYRYPDILIKLDDRIINIEIDEYQHVHKKDDDNVRNLEIRKKFRNKPLLIIRFNPHGYKKEEKIVSSCWGNNNGKRYICDKYEWDVRLNVLENHVLDFMNKVQPFGFDIVYLFYDS